MDAIVTAGGIPQPEDPLYTFSNGDAKSVIPRFKLKTSIGVEVFYCSFAKVLNFGKAFQQFAIFLIWQMHPDRKAASLCTL